MKKNIFILITLISLTTNLFAQQSKEQQLSKFIEEALKVFPVVPSISVSVANDKETLFAEGFGHYDIENNLKSNSNTNYYIASTTKSFVGLLALILADEGKIDLNEQITNYKPFKNFSNKNVFNGITVKDLVTHQTGLDNNYLSFLLAYSGDYDSKTILKLINEESIPNKNGKAFKYTNYGYYLFAILLHEEFGLNWKKELEKKIFKPLNMQNTTAYISKANEVAFPYNSVFKKQLKKLHLQKTDKTMHAAGGIISNANDISKFLSFCIDNGKNIVPENLIKRSYATQASSEHKGIKVFEGKGYGIGWRLGEFSDKEVVYHFGGYTGYYSHLSFLPKQKLGVAVFVNHEFGLPIGNLIANYAYDLYLGNTNKLKKHEKTLKKKFPKLLKAAQKSQLAHEKKQASRSWQLTLQKQDYVGSYTNEKFGTAKVTFQNGKNYIETGSLKAECTPFPQENTMRVELIPNSGTVIRFIIENGKVTAISYAGEKFLKTK